MDVTRGGLGRVGALAVVLGVALAVVAVWLWAGLGDLRDPAAIVARIERFGAGPLTPLLIVAAFVVGGLVVFPVTALITVSGLLLDPLPAFATATAGVMASSSALYAVGNRLGSGVDAKLGPRASRVATALTDRGVLSVATLRMLPVAPFSIVGLVIGASRIRFSDYTLGTLIGMAPGLVLFTVLGDQLGSLVADPDPLRLALLGLGAVGWMGVVFALQGVLSRRRARAAALVREKP